MDRVNHIDACQEFEAAVLIDRQVHHAFGIVIDALAKSTTLADRWPLQIVIIRWKDDFPVQRVRG